MAFRSIEELRVKVNELYGPCYEKGKANMAVTRTEKYVHIKCGECKNYAIWFMEKDEKLQYFRTINKMHYVEMHTAFKPRATANKAI